MARPTLSWWDTGCLLLVGILNSRLAVPRVCTFSALFWDIHDYPVDKGGDGTYEYFYTYTCWQCSKTFTLS